MNVTTPTEMVAADQLFKAVLQQSNTAISDKESEFENVMCPMHYTVKPNIDCSICKYSGTCVSKQQIETLKTEYQTLIDERVQITQKYSELQDAIKNYLLS